MTRGRLEQCWWREAVLYEVYVRSFADLDGDGSATWPASSTGGRTWLISASMRCG